MKIHITGCANGLAIKITGLNNREAGIIKKRLLPVFLQGVKPFNQKNRKYCTNNGEYPDGYGFT